MQTEDNLGGSFILTSATNRKKERKNNLFTISGGANREDPPVPFAHPSVAHPRDLAGGGASRAGKFTAARRKIHRRARTNASGLPNKSSRPGEQQAEAGAVPPRPRRASLAWRPTRPKIPRRTAGFLFYPTLSLRRRLVTGFTAHVCPPARVT